MVVQRERGQEPELELEPELETALVPGLELEPGPVWHRTVRAAPAVKLPTELSHQ